jgi:hypothetical protein
VKVTTCLHPVLRLRMYAWWLINIWQTRKHCPIKRIPRFIWKSNTDPQWAFKLNSAPAMAKMWGFKSLMPKVKHLDNLTCLPHLLKNYSNSNSTYSRTANCMLYFAYISNRKTVLFRLSTKACFLLWHPRICISISGTSSQGKILYLKVHLVGFTIQISMFI